MLINVTNCERITETIPDTDRTFFTCPLALRMNTIQNNADRSKGMIIMAAKVTELDNCKRQDYKMNLKNYRISAQGLIMPEG